MAALILALFLLKAQQKQLGLQKEEFAAMEQDKRKGQARLVSAWCASFGERFIDDMTASILPGEKNEVSVAYRNRSEEPVFACNVYVGSDLGPDAKWTRAWLDVLPPGFDDILTVRTRLTPGLLTLPPVEMRFTDASGRHWHRRGNGVLEQLAENSDNGPC